jgi:hypothetical protein
MGATFIEHGLKKAIVHHLTLDPDDPEFNFLFEGDEASYSRETRPLIAN